MNTQPQDFRRRLQRTVDVTLKNICLIECDLNFLTTLSTIISGLQNVVLEAVFGDLISGTRRRPTELTLQDLATSEHTTDPEAVIKALRDVGHSRRPEQVAVRSKLDNFHFTTGARLPGPARTAGLAATPVTSSAPTYRTAFDQLWDALEHTT